MKINLTNTESEEYFYNALCNGLDYFHSFGIIETRGNDYKNAKEKLINPCIEDVYMQVLKDGNVLYYIDNEDINYDTVISLETVHERVKNTPIHHLTDMMNKTDDADTASAIIQTVLFNEILFC